MGKVETIFDYELTRGELNRFNLTSPKLIEMTKEIHARSNDDRLYALGLLFAMRGDYVKAAEYRSKIERKSLLDTLIEDF
jgi:hypothetical protein